MNIKAPDLGVDEAEVSEILVKVGDVVEKDQSLLVLESAKASVEVPSPTSGTIKTIVIKTGQSVQQGDVLFELEDDVDSKSDGNDNSDLESSDLESSDIESSDRENRDRDKDNASNPDQSAPKQIQDADSDPELSSDTTFSNTTQSSIKEVKVPDLGVDEAEVSEILVKVGDVVKKDQSLLVLESAKASVEVPSPFAGIIKNIQLKAGEKVQQGVLMLSIEVSAASNETNAQPASTSDSKQTKQQNTAQTTSLDSRINQKSANNPADNSLAKNNQQDTQPSQNQPLDNQFDNQALSQEELSDNAKVYAGPAVRQLARQLGVVLAKVKASGNNQRIVKEDVLAFVKQHFDSQQSDSSQSAPANQDNGQVLSGLPTLPDFEKFGGGKVAAMTRLQQVSVPQLSLNNFIPQVTQFDLADITDLENWRNTLKADYKQQNISLTILAFIIKALAYLLKQEPHFNSHLADDQKSVLLRNEIHIGIAVATEDGLTVPVLRHPDRLSIKEIAIQLGELSQKARDKKLKPQDLQGASFTVTSLGSIGGTAFTPLVNWPQVAILGISPASMQPVWNGNDFEPRLMLPLSLSYDHRVINGADAARFSHLLTQLLADIRKILL